MSEGLFQKMDRIASNDFEGMATLITPKLGYGFTMVIRTNDHNPPHCHIFKEGEDVAQVILPKSLGEKLEMLQGELSNKEKKVLGRWFGLPSKFNPQKDNLEWSWDAWENEVEAYKK